MPKISARNIFEDAAIFFLMASLVFISVLSGWKSGLLSFVIATVIGLLIALFRNWNGRNLPFILKVYIFFTILNIFSVLYSIKMVFAFDIVLKMMATCVILFVCYNYCITASHIKTMIGSYLICSLSLALYNAIFFVPNIFRELPYGGPNPVALLMFISIVFTILLAQMGTKMWLWLLPVYLYVLFLTESQKSILSLLIIFLIYLVLILFYFKVSTFARYLAAGLLLLGLSFFILSGHSNLADSFERTSATIQSVFTGTKVEGAAGGIDGEGFRKILKERGWHYFTEQPFFGYGTNNFRALHERDYNFVTYTHYTPLEVVLNIGFLGFFIYYAIYFLVLRDIFYQVRKGHNTVHAYLFSVVIATIVIGFYMQTYADPSIQLFLICTLMISYLTRANPNKQKNVIRIS